MPFQKFGRYEIERELGRGGMAVVYLARDPYMKRQVAVKVLPPQFTSDPQFRARFQREAEVIAALEHPHIVPIYDYGEQDEQLFLVMRYMTGGSLADRVRRGPLCTTEIARIVAPLASALDKAHARGIIHRDLKPGNILFDADGEPYISDFGIAKLTQASTLLSGSALVGTPVYMSPEQWRGETVDGRSDIYALGGMLFEMLSGRLPYEASTPAEVMFKCLMEPPPRLLDTIPDLAPMLETVIARAMAKDRDERFATAGELARMLETAVRSAPLATGVPVAEPAVATPTPPATPMEVSAPTPVEIAPEAVEAGVVAAPEVPLPAPIAVEESPPAETPIAPPTVVAVPPAPTIPVPIAAAPEAIEAVVQPMPELVPAAEVFEPIAEPIPEAPSTVAAPLEAVEAAPLIAPVAEVEAPSVEACGPVRAESLAEAALLETPFVEVEVPPAEAVPEACEDLTGLGLAETEARPAAPALTAELESIAPTPTVAPPSRPTIARAPRPLARFALPAAGIVVIVLLIVGGVIFGPGWFSPAVKPTAMSAAMVEASPSPTLTPSSLPTSPPTPTPTITRTRTPVPTFTPEPPDPIVAFSELILAAIANQKPDFQDDFSTRAGGWTKAGGCADWRLKYVDGEMVVSDCQVSREMWYTDFVVEMDSRFLPGSPRDSQWRFHYRMGSGEGGGAPYFFDFRYSGNVAFGFEVLGSPGKYTDFPDAARPGANVNNHVLIIVKDQNVALFVNDQPIYYGALPILWKNGGMEWSPTGTVAFDNFKVWDISELPLAPTSTPRPTATSTTATSPDTGTVTGRTLWNGQPIAGVTVKLCTKWVFKCETTAYSAVSDAQGRYTITGIPPGDYNFVTKMPDQKGEVGAIDERIKINAGLNTWGDTPVCCKQDLQLISPAHEATVSSTTPTLSWKAYPYATSYEVYLNCPGYPQWVIRDISRTQWTVDAPLPSGVICTWRISASGPNGPLADSRFYNFNVP